MKSSLGFGKILALLLPGFVGFWALAYRSWVVARWFQVSRGEITALDNIFFVLLGSLALGVILNAFRWLIFDRFLNARVFRVPAADAGRSRLAEDEQMGHLLDDHYSFYQLYSAMAVAIAFADVMWLTSRGAIEPLDLLFGLVVLVAVIVLSLAAVDALKRHVGRFTMPPP